MATSTTSSTSSWTSDGVWECWDEDHGVLVQRVPSEKLVGSEEEDFDWCNTCNHLTKFKLSFFDNLPRDDDDNYYTSTKKHDLWKEAAGRWRAWYNERKSQTCMKNWYPVLGHLCGERYHNAIVFIITADQQKAYFEPAWQLAQNHARAKRLLEDEAEELAAKLVQSSNDANKNRLLNPPDEGWFVRTSDCSPKDAFQDDGSGPHRSLEAVLPALMASERVHQSIRKSNYNGDDMVVYLVPFDPSVDVERELRVFVHQNKVTAISQYDVYHSSNVFAPMTTPQLAKVARAVDDFHRTLVKPHWTINSSYTMDLEYINTTVSLSSQDGGEAKDGMIRLIELNSFGTEMAAASVWFHWERDEAILYGSTLTKDRKEEDERMVCIRIRE